MPDRTKSPERAVISLTPATRDKLNDVIAALERQEGRSATHEQLIGALLEGVPLWQTELMLRAYIKHAASSQSTPIHGQRARRAIAKRDGDEAAQ